MEFAHRAFTKNLKDFLDSKDNKDLPGGICARTAWPSVVERLLLLAFSVTNCNNTTTVKETVNLSDLHSIPLKSARAKYQKSQHSEGLCVLY